jgi:hypothetical protein
MTDKYPQNSWTDMKSIAPLSRSKLNLLTEQMKHIS